MPLDPITLVNRACARIGIDPLGSFSEEFAGSKAGLIYTSMVEFCLALYPWSFAQEMRVLTRLAAASGFGFAYVYQLPADKLGPPLRITDDATDPRRRFTGYVLSADQAHSDALALFALTKFRADPSRWPATFAHAVDLALSGEFAGTMADDFKARESYRIDAFGFPEQNFRGGAMGAAINVDAQATPPKQLIMGVDPLTAAHQS